MVSKFNNLKGHVSTVMSLFVNGHAKQFYFYKNKECTEKIRRKNKPQHLQYDKYC